MDGLFEAILFAPAEQFDAIPVLVYAVGVEEFAHGDGVSGVDTTLVNPFLDTIEIDGD